MKIIRICIVVVLVMLLTVGGSSCKKSNEPSIEPIINYMREKEYVRIYSSLSQQSKKEVTINEFTDLMERTYGTMTVVDMAPYVTQITTEGDTSTVSYTVRYDTERYDSISFDYTLDFVLEDDQWRIVYSPSMVIPSMGTGEKIQMTILPPKRGEIFDRNGSVIAKNDYAITVYANIDKIRDGETFVRTLAPLLGVTEKYISDKIEAYYKKTQNEILRLEQQEMLDAGVDIADEDIIPMFTQYNQLVILKIYDKAEGISDYIQEQILVVSGVGIDSTSLSKIRSYPYGQLMCHTIGYTGVISETEIAKPEYAMMPPDTIVGKDGIEKKYDSILRGTYGYKMDIIGVNNTISSTPLLRQSVAGTDIWLTVDVDTQLRTEMLLMQSLTGEMSGCALVLDPMTGQIESIASNPGYNPNMFSFGISTQLWEELNATESKNPLYNRVTSGLYPPGSVFKPFTAAIAMDTNKVPYDYVMKGQIEDNKWTPRDDDWVFPPVTRYQETYGLLNLRNAMINSDNIYFAFAALEVGMEQFYSEMQRIGFDTAIATDISIATPKITNSGSFEKKNMLADTGYGQGELLITPLQMAAMFSVFANNGDIMQPYIVESTRAEVEGEYRKVTETVPMYWKQDVVAPYSVSKIDELLKAVVAQGTGSAVKISGLNVYGKTGTAEIGSDKSREIAWFIGYVRYPEPRLVCVTIEVPAGEGAVRYNIAKTLLADNYEAEQDD